MWLTILYALGAVLALLALWLLTIPGLNWYYVDRFQTYMRLERQRHRGHELGEHVRSLVAMAQRGSFANSPRNRELLVGIQEKIGDIEHHLRQQPSPLRRRTFIRWIDRMDDHLNVLEILFGQLRNRLLNQP